jgi:hypothetical protein
MVLSTSSTDAISMIEEAAPLDWLCPGHGPRLSKTSGPWTKSSKQRRGGSPKIPELSDCDEIAQMPKLGIARFNR